MSSATDAAAASSIPGMTVTTLLTLAQAILKCAALGYNPLFTRVAWNECIAEYTT